MIISSISHIVGMPEVNDEDQLLSEKKALKDMIVRVDNAVHDIRSKLKAEDLEILEKEGDLLYWKTILRVKEEVTQQKGRFVFDNRGG